MTDLDWPPPPLPDMTALERTPRKHRHVWLHYPAMPDSQYGQLPARTVCQSCSAVRDEVKARRGKSSRRLGSDQERRIERVYGPVKRGEYGDPVDHVGRIWRWQSKATRSLPPRWLALIARPTPRIALPSAVERAHAGMAHHFDPHRSVVIRSFVANGLRTRDWLFVDWRDAVGELGLTSSPYGWWVIPGDWFLDHFGRDE